MCTDQRLPANIRLKDTDRLLADVRIFHGREDGGIGPIEDAAGTVPRGQLRQVLEGQHLAQPGDALRSRVNGVRALEGVVLLNSFRYLLVGSSYFAIQVYFIPTDEVHLSDGRN